MVIDKRMAAVNMKAGQAIEAQRASVVESIMSRQCELQPDLMSRFDEAGRQKCLEDINYHLDYLAASLQASSPALFAEYLAWAKVLLVSLGLPEECLIKNIECIRDILSEQLPEDAAGPAAEYAEQGLREVRQMPTALPSFIREDNPQADLARSYLNLLLQGDRQLASRLILNAVDEGVEVRDIYLNVFETSQQEVGRLWQINRLSVAQEHYCTAATQLIMSQLYPHIFATEKKGRTLVATCVNGELHEVGVRMVADLFEMDGWDTFYLGSNTPADSIIQMVLERKADALGISATITSHVPAVATLIEMVRSSEVGHRVKILVGGYPFNIAPETWQMIGADGYAHSADQAVIVAERLVSD